MKEVVIFVCVSAEQLMQLVAGDFMISHLMMLLYRIIDRTADEDGRKDDEEDHQENPIRDELLSDP